mmetsp:Transcript_53050/g.152916  ORF Transcript_53050/g.152916 Transcript_53050/m.152916 type:complete len:269 (-) Transcript_53050:363-1169(-)
MGDVCALSDLDPPSAEPRADRLVDILASPSHHVLIVAFRLLPPPPAHRQQPAAHERHVAARNRQPREVGVPRHVASLPRRAVVDLLPRVRVQRRDRGHNDGLVIPLSIHLPKKGVLPTSPRLHMAVQEHDDVSGGCVPAALLCGDQPQGLLVPNDPHWRRTGAAGEQLRGENGFQRRVAPIVDDDDLLDAVVLGVVPDRVHRLLRELALEGAREHNAEGFQLSRRRAFHLRPPSHRSHLLQRGSAHSLLQSRHHSCRRMWSSCCCCCR